MIWKKNLLWGWGYVRNLKQHSLSHEGLPVYTKAYLFSYSNFAILRSFLRGYKWLHKDGIYVIFCQWVVIKYPMHLP